MPETTIKKTRNKLARTYGVGTLAFTAVLGSITVLASFLERLNMM